MVLTMAILAFVTMFAIPFVEMEVAKGLGGIFGRR
jgi:Tfp pilus assembly protein FimT